MNVQLSLFKQLIPERYRPLLLQWTFYLFIVGSLFWKTSHLFFQIANLWWQWGSVLENLGILLILTGWTFLLRPLGQVRALICIDAIVTFILVADTLYYRYFHDFVSIPVLMEAFQLHEIGGSVVALIQLSDVIYIFDLVVILTVYSLINKSKIDTANKTGLVRRLIAAGLLSILGLQPFGYQINMIEQTTPALFTTVYSHLAVANQLGVIGYHVQDAYLYFVEYVMGKKSLSAARKNQIVNWFSA